MAEPISVLGLMDTLTSWFKGESWSAWRALLAALFALPMTEAQVAIYRRHTGREQAPTQPAREGWLLIGRRGGKSIIVALCALVAAVFRSYVLAPGERGLVMIIAADRRQGRVVFRYICAFFDRIAGLAQLIERRTQEALHLSNGISIEVHTASYRSIRGYTVVAFIGDEIAFWRAEDSANPDTEILNAVRPAMATVPGALMLCVSSPYARRGALWAAYTAHYGREGDRIFVWCADSMSMNPTLDSQVVADAYEQDESVAAAEYGRDGIVSFRRDIEAFVSREVLEVCVVPGRVMVPPISTNRYCAFADPAGGERGGLVHVGHCARRRAGRSPGGGARFA